MASESQAIKHRGVGGTVDCFVAPLLAMTITCLDLSHAAL
jgi:hypothetical protein